MGGASGERQVEQQVHAEIDPRPDKEEEDDDGQPRDLSFIGPAVQGGETTQSDASSPESCTPIGPWPRRDPAATPGSGLILHLASHRRAVESSCSEHRDMNRLALNSGPCSGDWPRAASAPHACSGTTGALQLVLINALVPSVRHAARAIRAVQHASTWWRLPRGGCAGRYWWPRWRAKVDGTMPL